jgi:hypothetical protein
MYLPLPICGLREEHQCTEQVSYRSIARLPLPRCAVNCRSGATPSEDAARDRIFLKLRWVAGRRYQFEKKIMEK